MVGGEMFGGHLSRRSKNTGYRSTPGGQDCTVNQSSKCLKCWPTEGRREREKEGLENGFEMQLVSLFCVDLLDVNPFAL